MAALNPFSNGTLPNTLNDSAKRHPDLNRTDYMLALILVNLAVVAQAAQADLSADSIDAQTHRMVSSDVGVNATVVKASAGRVLMLEGYNSAAQPRWLKLYDTAATPVMSGDDMDTPVWSKFLPPQDVFALNPADIHFENGIAYAFTVNGPDGDDTPIAADDIQGFNLSYV